MIRIKGLIHNRVSNFITINLQSTPVLSPTEINLHLSIRVGDRVVVRNHKHGNNWGVEERSGGFPFAIGQPFEVLLLAEQRQFKVAVNGQHFCDFAHRLPLNEVNFITITGDLTIHAITSENDFMPSAPPIMPFGTSAGAGKITFFTHFYSGLF